MSPEQKQELKEKYGVCNDHILDAAYWADREYTEEHLRETFENIVSYSPYEWNVDRFPDNPEKVAWPGQYVDHIVQTSWEFFLAGFMAANGSVTEKE